MLTNNDFGIADSVSPDPGLHPLLTIMLLPIVLVVLLVIGVVVILYRGGAYVANGVCLKRGWHRFLVENEENLGYGGYRRMERCIACGRRRIESRSPYFPGEIP